MKDRILRIKDTTIVVTSQKGVLRLLTDIMHKHDLFCGANSEGVIAIHFKHYPSYRKIYSKEIKAENAIWLKAGIEEKDLLWLKEEIDNIECLLFVLMQL